MSRFPSIFRRDAHAYTRSPSPWIIGERPANGGKLIKYISGGGMRMFGRTVSQEEAHAKHVRFLLGFAVFAAVWLVLYFI